MRIFISIFLFFQAFSLLGQEKIKDFVREHAVAISAISPDSTNYGDLDIIANSIGDAQVVMLGEQDHGDASAFLAKTRLIKYLHEKKGFNVLAFESDFFGLNYGWDDNGNRSRMASFFQNNILSLWANCNGCKNLLYEYIPATQRTGNAINIAGFDNQMVYAYSRKYLIAGLDSVLQAAGIPITQQADYKSQMLPLLDTLVTRFGYQLPGNDFFVACGRALQAIKEQAKEKIAANSFWWLIINNLIAFNEEEANLKKDPWKAECVRDRQMYYNLKWLIQEKYPDQKIIVWAANNHVSKYSDKKYTTMGRLLFADSSLKRKIYVIGFTSYTGEGQRLYESRYSIGQPAANSFENWVNGALPYAFVDFSAYNREYPGAAEAFNMRAWRYRSRKEEWTKIFDGMFYIREMHPCESINSVR